jgi:hypothetical protein
MIHNSHKDKEDAYSKKKKNSHKDEEDAYSIPQ